MIGLVAIAYPASPPDLRRATDPFRLLRGRPTPDALRLCRGGPHGDLANERCRAVPHPDELHNRPDFRSPTLRWRSAAASCPARTRHRRPGHHRRVRGRKAHRNRRLDMARDAMAIGRRQAPRGWAHPPQSHDRGNRVHRLAADLDARLQGCHSTKPRWPAHRGLCAARSRGSWCGQRRSPQEGKLRPSSAPTGR